jgi:Helix-turn-helix domain
MPTVSITDGLLDETGAAEHLQVTRRALLDFCKRGQITYIKLDYRNRRFRLSDLDAFLESRTHRARGVCTREDRDVWTLDRNDRPNGSWRYMAAG